MTAPLLPLALAFAGGAALGLEIAAPAWIAALTLGVAAGALLAGRSGDRRAAAGAVLGLGMLAGWLRVGLPDPIPPTRGLSLGPTVLEGFVAGPIATDGPRTRLPLAIQAVVGPDGPQSASGRLAVTLYGPTPTVSPGDRVRVSVDLRAPGPFRNPGGPDLEDPAWSRQPRFVATGRAESVARQPPTPWPPRLLGLAARLWIDRQIQAQLPPASGALLEGLLTGERRQLPPTLLADFRRAGVLHVLAVSGFNVALVAGSVLLLLRLLRMPPPGAAAGALVALVGFAAIVSAEPSVLRASVMGGLFLLAQVLGRETRVWNSLAAALMGLVALDPGSLRDPGLQLSFAATAGILHLAPGLRQTLASRLPTPLAHALAVSAAAQLAVLPVAAVWWGELSLLGIVANLVVVPLAGLLTTLGGVALGLAALVETPGRLVFQVLWALLVALRATVRAVAALPGGAIVIPPPPTAAVLAGVAALALIPVAGGRLRRAAVVGLTLAAVGLTAWGALPDGRLRLLVLDVGQGEAILVRGPDGRALLVDTGGGGPGRMDRGAHVVLPTLRRLGVRQLDALALTQGDADHAGGLPSLLDGLPILEGWVPTGPGADAWRDGLERAGIRTRVLARGDRVWLGPLLVQVLHPPPDDDGWTGTRNLNDRSLVLRLDWGLAGALLAGDVGGATEKALLHAGTPLAAPILKVGHHGSRHASTWPFLLAVNPRVALVSAGTGNPFGHPHPATVGRLAVAGAAVYRTDLDGAIDLESDGASLRIRRWAAPAGTEQRLLAGAP